MSDIDVPATIRAVGNMKTRDLLRGLLNRGLDIGEARSTLFKLLDGVSGSDLLIVDELLRHDRLFEHLDLFAEFPAAPSYQGYRPLPLAPRDELAIEYISHRIAKSEQKICEAFRLLADLNRAICADDDLQIIAAIEALVIGSGYSLTLARKLSFIIGYAPKEMLSYKFALKLVEQFGISARNYGIMATVDSIGSEFNYLDLKYRFRKFASLARSDSVSRKISHLCFAPVADDSKHFSQLLVASYEVSLLDAAIALLVHRDHAIIVGPLKLPESVELAWRELGTSLRRDFDQFDNARGYGDMQAFRASPAFLEDARFSHLRLALQPLYCTPEARNPATFAPGSYPARFFDDLNAASDLVPPADVDFKSLPAVFNRKHAGILSRSCGIVLLFEQHPDFSDLSADDMALLMGATTEIDRLLSTDILRTAAGSAQDPFVKLLLHTLLRAHSAATRDSYKFKELFQAYVRANHSGDILDFLQKVNELNPEIVHYFVDLLDETMLSQMAFLMVSSNSIYETRACILEWFGTVTDDEVPKENARQLRLDRKIAAVRGAINETRLNIDAVRFRQWIEQTKLGSFSNFIRQDAPHLPSVEELTDKTKYHAILLAAHRVPTTRALEAIVECYEQFCKNADFGIASFLGRRIRHGTLRGTLLTALPDPSEVELPAQSLGQYQSWKAEFSTSINLLANRLHFVEKTSHKNGLISAEIDTPQKWQTCLVCLNAIFDQAQKDHGSLIIPILIEQYCWLIFEQELANVQASISDARNRWGILNLRYNPHDTDIIDFEKTTNLALAAQFNTVISWFKKPPNVSAVAEIAHVIEVVRQEACDEYSGFSPGIEYTGDPELRLSGSSYSHVYDGLTIAVRNAAKHGNWPGHLAISAEVLPQAESSVLRLTVTSELRSQDCPDKAVARMTTAARAGPQDADIVEGLSGMRKLEKMVVDRRVLDFQLCAIKDPHRVAVTMRFPFEGIVE